MGTSETSKGKARRRAKAVVFAFALAIICAAVHGPLLLKNARDLCDDAMISARFARNLTWGRGLRYNLEPASQKPVEGYSNFLWVMGMAAGERLRLPPRIYTAAMGSVSSLASILILALWVKKRTGSKIKAVMAALVPASAPAYAIWAVQGLETPLFAAAALAAVAVADPKKPGPAPYVLAAVCCLVRPDGLIVPASILIAQLIYPGRNTRRVFSMAGIFFGVPFLVYAAWRVLHFGAVIPNVFFAKTGLGAAGVLVGARYLGGFLASLWPAALLLIAGLVPLFSRRMAAERPALITPAVFVGLYLGFILVVGGDFMPDYRFGMHVLPVMIGTGVIGLSVLERDGGSIREASFMRFLLPALILVALAWNVWAAVSYERRPSFERDWHQNQATWYGRASSWLLRNSEPSDVIACGDIGYIGYVTGVDRILDTNGLVDPYLANRPGAASLDSDPAYVIEQKPRFVVVMVHFFEGGQVIGHSAFDRAVLSSGALERDYAVAVEVPGWRSVERSFADGVVRTSLVRFRIYSRMEAGGKSSR